MKTSVLNPDDFQAACTLYGIVAKDFPDLSKDSFSSALMRNLRRGSVLGAYRNGELAGVLIYSPPLSRISFLVVSPVYRRQGIGRALMEAALVRLSGQAELFTYAPEDPSSPGPAYRLYRSLGFEETGRAPGYNTAVVHMRKSKIT